MAAVLPIPPVGVGVPPPVPDLQAVFSICGSTTEATHTCIINNERYTSLEDLAVMDNDLDVMKMVKHLVGGTLVDGHIYLGTVQIKHIQALVWWVYNRIKHGQVLVVAEFDVAAMNLVMERKHIDKEHEMADVSVENLAKFKLEDFDIHDDAFLNMLVQIYSVEGELLHYVVHNAVASAVFADNNIEECMYQLPLARRLVYDDDNCNVYCKLKAFLINTARWAWIEPFNVCERMDVKPFGLGQIITMGKAS